MKDYLKPIKDVEYRLSEEEKEAILSGIAFQGLSPDRACIAASVPPSAWESEKKVDKEFDQKLSTAIRVRGPVSKQRMARFDTNEDRKRTQMLLRDAGVDEKFLQVIGHMPTDEESIRCDAKLRGDWIRLMQARWTTQDRNVTQHNTHSFEERQVISGDKKDLIEILQKNTEMLAELSEQRAVVEADRSKMRQRIGDAKDVDFRLSEKAKPE